jgi:hypothetical protein
VALGPRAWWKIFLSIEVKGKRKGVLWKIAILGVQMGGAPIP